MSKPDVLVMYPARPGAGAMARLEAAHTLRRLDEAGDKPAAPAEQGPGCVAAVTNGHAAPGRAGLAHLPKAEISARSPARSPARFAGRPLPIPVHEAALRGRRGA